jgi:hypothetical protein
MSALSIQPTYPIFTETDGQPLENGYIWIGTVNLDPQVNPINVYFDAALTILAPQPIRTLGGYPSRNGTPARLYVNSDYSIRVQDSKGSLVYSAPAATERYSSTVIVDVDANEVIFTGFKGQIGSVANLADNDGSDWIGFEPDGSGSVAISAQDKLRETVSVKDFGAVGDGIANDRTAVTDAITFAISSGKTLHFPAGTYSVFDITCQAFSMTAEQGAILKLGSGGTFLLNITSGNSFKLENITFDGNSTGTYAYTIANVDGVAMNNVSVTGFADRCCVLQQSVTNVQIVGGTYSDNTGADTLVLKSNYNTITGCNFKDIPEHAVRFGRFNSDANVDSGAYSTISNCTFENVTNDPVLCELDSKFITIEGNQFYECRNICKITAATDDCHSVSVIGNTFRKPKGVTAGFTRGVSAADSDKITVVGNVIDLNGSEVGGVATNANAGIVVGSNSIVSSNIIVGASQDGIIIGENSSATNNSVTDFTLNGIACGGINCSVSANILSSAIDSVRGIRSAVANTTATANRTVLTGATTIGFSGTGGATNATVVANNFIGASTSVSVVGAGLINANNQV